MQNNASSKIIFRGYRRVFFLVFALAMFMQAGIFMQSRIETALKLINEDFKIVLAFNTTDRKQAQEFQTNVSNVEGVESIDIIEPNNVLAALNDSGNSMSAQAVNADFLPAFFEVKVNKDVLLNPKVWVQDNISALNQDVSTYYKEDQAKLAVYINAINKFAIIALLAGAFSLLVFGFFVEAFYTKIMPLNERFGGVFSALLAYVLSAGAAFALAYPLNSMNPDFRYCLLTWQQAALGLLCLSAGWTLAKWKKF